MFEFFHRYVAEILGDAAFRLRHPHFHRRVIDVELLDHIDIPTLSEADAAKQAKYAAAFAAGDRVPPFAVQILADSSTLVFDGPVSVLAAARAAGVVEHMARIAYDSTLVSDAFWNSRSAERATAQLLITEDGESLISENGVEYVA